MARSPLLRKGGPHERSASSIRAGYRRTIDAGIDAYHGLGPDEMDADRPARDRKPLGNP